MYYLEESSSLNPSGETSNIVVSLLICGEWIICQDADKKCQPQRSEVAVVEFQVDSFRRKHFRINTTQRNICSQSIDEVSFIC